MTCLPLTDAAGVSPAICGYGYTASAESDLGDAGAADILDEELALDLYSSSVGAPAAQKTSAKASATSGKKTSSRSGKGSANAAGSVQASAAPFKATASNYPLALAKRSKPVSGKFTLSGSSRFYIASERPSDELFDTMRLMSYQFKSRGLPSHDKMRVVTGPASGAKAGDIVIRLVPRSKFKSFPVRTADINQSYKLIIGKKAVITGCSSDGIYYGLIELMEITAAKRAASVSSISSNKTVSKGSQSSGSGNTKVSSIRLRRAKIYDGPDYKERTLHLDCGRKYFSPKWIKKLIRRASLQRYNAISLHFSEAEGLRLDSERFPWLTSDIKSLSRQEMADIVRYASRRHIKVIPSFDTPSHNKYIVKRYAAYVKKHPQFSFSSDGKTYNRKKTKGFASIANHFQYNGAKLSADYVGIDVTRPHAVAFINELIDDYAEFFQGLGCEDFDLCGDEILGWYTFNLGGKHFTYDNRWSALEHWKRYAVKHLGIRNGSAADTFINYLNKTAARVRKKGLRVRVFNDDIDILKSQHLKLNKKTGVTYWYTADNTGDHFRKAGHRVYGCVERWCFYVVRKNNGKDIMKGRYRSVNSKNIYENWNPGKYDGCYFCIWCDHPDYKSADTIWKETWMRTWAYGSRMWNRKVNSSGSGIGRTASYRDLEGFAGMMK